MKIGIVIGSIRDGREGAKIGEWVNERAQRRASDHPGVTYEVIDLKSFNVPLLTASTVPAAANRVYDSPEVTAWSEAIDACDAYVFVTPEYNHGLPGAFKNAVDSLYPEWVGKPVGFVAYGAASGFRVVEQWRPVVANMQMLDVRAQVGISLMTEIDDDGVPIPSERRDDELDTLFDQVESLCAKLTGSISGADA